MVLTLMFGVCFVLMFLGMPIVFVLGISSLAYILLSDLSLASLTHKLALSVASFPMLAIPLFMFAGKLMNRGGITDRIFGFANNLVGHIRGGLGHVNVVASIIFAGMSGSVLADVAGLGEIEMKAMGDAGYDKEFSMGITLGSSVIGPIFPPSVPMVLFGVIAEVSITGLFLGGFLPGLVIAACLMVFIYVICRRRNYPTSPLPPFPKLLKSFVYAFPPIFTPVIIVGGMTLGIFSPTEAAAVAVLYCILLGTVVYRELGFKDFRDLLVDTVLSTSKLMLVIATALLFGWILTLEEIPQRTASLLASISTNISIILFIINLTLLFLGAIIENAILLLILAPMLVPAMEQLGVDPIHFGVVMVFNIMIGQYTPPMGLSLYIMKDITGLPFEQVCKAAFPFLLPLVSALFLLTYIPQIVLFVPRFLGF
jgi:tripartite ATP-independent transporter DctM subunit